MFIAKACRRKDLLCVFWHVFANLPLDGNLVQPAQSFGESIHEPLFATGNKQLVEA
jgi:hypothetical protein